MIVHKRYLHLFARATQKHVRPRSSFPQPLRDHVRNRIKSRAGERYARIRVLYRFDWRRSAIRAHDRAVICIGYIHVGVVSTERLNPLEKL